MQSSSKTKPTPAGKSGRARLDLAAQIRAAIVQRKYAPGHPVPSVRALMSQTGRSTDTVQAALRLLVREGLLENRRGSGHYVRQLAAAKAAGVTQKSITVVLPSFSNPNEQWYIAPLLFSMVTAAVDVNAALTLAQHHSQAQPQTNAPLLQELSAQRPHGVVWVHAFAYEVPELQQLQAARIPVVTTMRRIGDVPLVREDDRAYARLIVEQLVSRGHRSLAIIGSEYGDEYYESKFAALAAAGRRRGLTVRRADWLQQGIAHTPFGADSAQIAKFLEERPHLTALLVLFSYAIIRFGDLFHSPLADRMKRLTIIYNVLDAVTPPHLPTGESLATITPPVEEIGRQVIATLDAAIEARPLPRQAPLTPIFQAGDSLRPAASEVLSL